MKAIPREMGAAAKLADQNKAGEVALPLHGLGCMRWLLGLNQQGLQAWAPPISLSQQGLQAWAPPISQSDQERLRRTGGPCKPINQSIRPGRAASPIRGATAISQTGQEKLLPSISQPGHRTTSPGGSPFPILGSMQGTPGTAPIDSGCAE